MPRIPPPRTQPPAQTVTLDGVDAAAGVSVQQIRLWKDYLDRNAGVAAMAAHGDTVKLIRREGNGCLVETADGTQGWVTYWFLKELKG